MYSEDMHMTKQYQPYTHTVQPQVHHITAQVDSLAPNNRACAEVKDPQLVGN